jgi:hypothetical protein
VHDASDENKPSPITKLSVQTRCYSSRMNGCDSKVVFFWTVRSMLNGSAGGGSILIMG